MKLSLYFTAWCQGLGPATQVWGSDRSIEAKIRLTVAEAHLSPLKPKVVKKATAMRMVLRERD